MPAWQQSAAHGRDTLGSHQLALEAYAALALYLAQLAELRGKYSSSKSAVQQSVGAGGIRTRAL